MTVRCEIALTISLTGLADRAGGDRHGGRWRSSASSTRAPTSAPTRSSAASWRCTTTCFEQHERDPEEFNAFLRNLVLFEPDSQLYLLDADGTVLAAAGSAKLPPGLQGARWRRCSRRARPAATPVPLRDGRRPRAHGRQRASSPRAAAPRGDPARRRRRPATCTWCCRKPGCRARRAGRLLAQQPRPAGAGLRWSRWSRWPPRWRRWIIVAVTRPLRVLSDAVAAVAAARAGSPAPARADAAGGAAARRRRVRPAARAASRRMLATLRAQWDELRRLDHFRREGVSNLSHDLRSPLTATVACLETLEQRWAGRRRRAATTAGWWRWRCATPATPRGWCGRWATWRSSTSPSSGCTPRRSTWANCSTTSRCASPSAPRSRASTLRCAQRRRRARAGGRGRHRAVRARDRQPDRQRAEVHARRRAHRRCAATASSGQARGRGQRRRHRRAASPPADLPHLFDRFYQSRDSVAPATGDGGKGLGLAIVKRIVELHGGAVAVRSAPVPGRR